MPYWRWKTLQALLVALRHVAKAHGMAEVTRRAGLGEKVLFRALSEQGNPTVDTLTKVPHAMGLRLSVEPLAA
ncbi:addiction module antidote protein [Bordetella sp. FB-8]|uniref:addiction module antidote protein n=1 Tax=Bordetella sp. FB-8 TaxID=1159870 RepID=UPI0003697D05|nr:addiction module antidote protein [Bordetella sp. FB-8]